LWEIEMKKLLLAAVAAVTLSPAVQAADYVCGVSSTCDFTEVDATGSFGTKVNALSVFDDFYEVTLGSGYNISVTMTSSVTPFLFTALDLVAADKTTSLGSFLAGGIITPLATTVSAGTYYVHVAGSVIVNKKSTYTGTIDIAPVPEPATWAMMIAGIAVVGTAMRRRSTLARVSFS
jgi:opacity protein-like surface antigen